MRMQTQAEPYTEVRQNIFRTRVRKYFETNRQHLEDPNTAADRQSVLSTEYSGNSKFGLEPQGLDMHFDNVADRQSVPSTSTS